MVTVLISVLLVVLLFAAMAIGVICGRAPIKGSCGGMAALGVQGDCDICGGDPGKCDDVVRASRGDVTDGRVLGAVEQVNPRQTR